MAKLSRRQFLFSGVAAGLALAFRHRLPAAIESGRLKFPTTSTAANRVVHTHSNFVTSWDYATGWYGDYVSQAVVDLMTDRGMMELTGSFFGSRMASKSFSRPR